MKYLLSAITLLINDARGQSSSQEPLSTESGAEPSEDQETVSQNFEEAHQETLVEDEEQICEDKVDWPLDVTDYSLTVGDCCQLNVQCRSACCEANQCVFTIMPCESDGSIKIDEQELIENQGVDQFAENLGLQDQLVEAIHVNEQENEEDSNSDKLALEHDGFYTDNTHESPFEESHTHKNHLDWLGRQDP